jgi:deoxyribonuclease-4
LLLGAHESTSGGLHEAFGRAASDGCEAVQIFTKSSRQWAAKAIAPEEAATFRAEAGRTGFGPSTSVHASYLINLGAGDGDLRDKSIAAFTDEIQRCDALGVPFLVVHPGSNADTRAGLRNIARGLDQTFAAHRGACQVLLETAAGQGVSLGRSFAELREIRDQVRSPARVAVCLDTCHVFAAGYDLSTERGYHETFDEFERTLGIELLKAFHLNDSVKPLGCRVDRHELAGKGEIGPVCFRLLVNDPRFQLIPGYLEIPPEGNKACLRGLRAMRAKTAPAPAPKPRRSRVASVKTSD